MTNKLTKYIIDEASVFSDEKNDKFLLLEELNKNKYYQYKYKDQTNNFISYLINNREKYKFEDIIKVVNNREKDKLYYDKIKNLLNEGQINDLKYFEFSINNYKNFINSLEGIKDFLEKFYFQHADDDIIKLHLLIEQYKKNYISEIENLKKDAESLLEKYNQKTQTYYNYTQTQLFLALYYKINNDDKLDTDESLEKSKNIFDDFCKILFEKDIFEEQRNIEGYFLFLFEELKKISSNYKKKKRSLQIYIKFIKIIYCQITNLLILMIK